MLSKKSFLFLAIAAFTGSLQAAINLEFTGGEGSPLTVTLTQDVDFEIVADNGFPGPIFIIDGLAGYLAPGLPDGISGGFSGELFYTINGGSDVQIGEIGSGGPSGSAVTPDDLYMVGSIGGFNVGDIVTLKAGSVTTNDNYITNLPANGSFEAFLVDIEALPITATPAVPEPSTYAAIAGALGLAFVALRKRLA